MLHFLQENTCSKPPFCEVRLEGLAVYKGLALHFAPTEEGLCGGNKNFAVATDSRS